MTVRITFGQLMDAGLWERFCEATGTNPWCMSEGLADRDTGVEISADALHGISRGKVEAGVPDRLGCAVLGVARWVRENESEIMEWLWEHSNQAGREEFRALMREWQEATEVALQEIGTLHSVD